MKEVTAPEEGFVVTLREYPMVHEQECVAVMLRENNRKWFWPFG